MTAPHTIHRVDNDMEKAPHGWPYAFVIRDNLGRYVNYFGFRDLHDEARSRELAEEARNEADWVAALPVGQRKGAWLETARAVRSRALDALSYLETDGAGCPLPDKYTVEEREIIADLRAVVRRLDPWQRTGRTPKYPGGTK